MMNGPEKSDPGVVAMKPANKAGQPACGANCGEPNAAESVEPRAGTKGNADQQSTRRTQRQESVTQALERIRHAIAVWTRGGSRMRESRKSGSVRGALGQRASLPRLGRREFIMLLGGAAAWPLVARAQQPDRTRRIGVLMFIAADDPYGQKSVKAFQEGLQELGWMESRNIRIDIRWAPNVESMGRFAKELVALQPDVILSPTSSATRSILEQTRIIPLIFAVANDPVSDGFVQSFARPGGNVTGFINMEPTMAGKWLELLKEIAPRVNSVAFMFNPATAPYFEYYMNPFKGAAPSFGMEAIAAPIHNVSELESVIAAQAREPNGSLIVMPDSFTFTHRAEVTLLAARYRLPAVYPFYQFTEVGGLISYGPDLVDQYRRAATYVDRILKGAKPSELPVQAPVKFEMMINLKTAKALGLDVPPVLLALADEVIE
jgi:putative ABC transport system substrate-binding protein